MQRRKLRLRKGKLGMLRATGWTVPLPADWSRRLSLAHLVAQLLGLLLQHGVALFVPAHVLFVTKSLHVFQLLVRNF